MTGRLVILGGALLALIWFLRWFRHTPPHQVARVLRKTVLYGAIALVILLAATGRLNPLFAAAAAAIPVIIRGINLLRLLPAIQQILRMFGIQGIPSATRGGDQGPAGRASSIRTRFLEMTLDHDSGNMDGLILEGNYQGQRLSELGLNQLLELLAVCRAEDAQSAAVLEAYLDRTNGDTWRDRVGEEGARAPADDGRMTEEEALAVLGLQTGASPEDVRDAHRRLMQKLHPDRGGSDYLAATINRAKRVLLGD